MASPSRPLRLLIASDKFKGSLSGPEACASIQAGIEEALGDRVECRACPVADGGDGMAQAVTEARGGRWLTTPTEDALGRPVEAGFGMVSAGDGTATGVIEMATASGLWRLDPEELDPWKASTRGTGMLIQAALDAGAERILLGIGGSATNDGGTGMAAALGVRFLGEEDKPIENLPADLETVRKIQPPESPAPEILVACDVTNPLLGPEGCTRIYGPQKGVREEDIEGHEARLRHLVSLCGEDGERDATLPGAGAAGGLGFGCRVFFQADLRPGFDLVAEILELEDAVRDCDLVITGEGKLDRQTMQGKAPAGVADLARRLGKPVAALAGCLAEGADDALAERFDFFTAIEAGNRSLEESMREAASLLRATARTHAEAIRNLTEAAS